MSNKYAVLDKVEQRFLAEYDIQKYERPSVTADVAVFTVQKNDTDSYRKNPECHLSLLLVKREEHPFIGKWALPGGFLKPGETVEECALRKIIDKTGVAPNSLMSVGMFSEPNRDPRGWILSNAFTFVLSEDLQGAVDDKFKNRAAWFQVDLEPLPSGSSEERFYLLHLSHGDFESRTVLKEVGNKFHRPRYEFVEDGDIAFDHAKIIACALSALRYESKNIDFAFDFLPEKFTLASLQKIHETLTNTSVVTANFRRKIAAYVEETEEYTEGAGHRPAKLFKRKV